MHKEHFPVFLLVNGRHGKEREYYLTYTCMYSNMCTCFLDFFLIQLLNTLHKHVFNLNTKPSFVRRKQCKISFEACMVYSFHNMYNVFVSLITIFSLFHNRSWLIPCHGKALTLYSWFLQIVWTGLGHR